MARGQAKKARARVARVRQQDNGEQLNFPWGYGLHWNERQQVAKSQGLPTHFLVVGAYGLTDAHTYQAVGHALLGSKLCSVRHPSAPDSVHPVQVRAPADEAVCGGQYASLVWFTIGPARSDRSRLEENNRRPSKHGWKAGLTGLKSSQTW